MAMMGVFIFLSSILLQSSLISCENVETRIHTLMTPKTPKVDFGRSVHGTVRSVYASAPDLGPSGGMYKCEYDVTNPTTNDTFVCPTEISFGTENATTGTSLEKVTVSGHEYFITCGNQYHFTCPKLQIQERMIGECYTYKVSGGSISTIPSPCPIACPQGISANIVFVIDGSGSVGAGNFGEGLKWIVNVLKKFSYDINLGNIHVGFVPFNGGVYEASSSLAAGTFYDFRDKALGIGYHRGGTNTPQAITTATNLLMSSTARTKVAKLMITMTDGGSTSGSPDASAAAAETNGITMIAVGIGSGIKYSELREIARHSSRILSVTDYSKLDGIIDTLSKVIEETAKGSLEGGSSNSTTEMTNCQFGSSIHASKNGLYIGAIGSYDRTGTVAEYNSLTNFPNLRSSGHLNATEMANNLNGVNATDLKESYFGYSVSSGTFTVDGREWVVMSAPRYLLKGMVLIYRETPTKSFYQLHPNDKFWQLGAYYGQSVLAMDIDNDNEDDLLVSSPLYSKLGGYDEGVVFVYMSKTNSISKWASSDFSPLVLEGDSIQGARFGMNLVDGGDIDKNGINDVIISSPSEGDEGSNTPSGSIYIYFSSSTGLSNSRKQKVFGRTVTSNTQSLRAFGWSTYGGSDYDKNGYPDVVVSAPSSNRLIVLWSRKIITITPSISIGQTSIDVKHCAANPTTACSNITVCLNAKYEDGTEVSKTFEITYNVTLDSLTAANKRLRFKDQSASIISETLRVGRTEICNYYDVALKIESLGTLSGGGGFQVTPRAELSVGLSDSHKIKVMSGVLSSSSQVRMTSDWSFKKGCSGINERCEHDLQLNVTSDTSSKSLLLLTDKSQKLKLHVTIENLGPDHAYFTRINVTSGNLTLNLVNGSCVTSDDEARDSSKGLAVIKFESHRAGLKDLMVSGDKCEFTLEFDFTRMKSTANEGNYNIQGVIYSTAGDDNITLDGNSANNRFSIQGSVQYQSSISITELSIPESIYFNRTSTDTTVVKTLEDEALAGNKTKLVHQYTLYNRGPLGFAKGRVKLTWPEYTQNGLYLLYLVGIKCKPESACTCDATGKANKFNLAPKMNSNETYENVTITYPDDSQAFGAIKTVTCANSKCSEVYCDLDYISRFGNIIVLAEFKPWIPTFGKEFSNTQIFSTLDLIVSNISSDQQSTNQKVTTELSTSPWYKEPTKNPLEWWQILLAILGGILLLVVAVLAMWKLGFFESKYKKRTRAGRQSIREREAAGPSDFDEGPSYENVGEGPSYENVDADAGMGQSTADLVNVDI
uniref:integrin alpha-1-like n=1 Tax=Styela clava TaxID=7725 RepID=UPI001939591A|nr:integrin alpha-1-like [Styela clava]